MPLSLSALLAVGLGAALGAWLRWGMGQTWNGVHLQIPLGTLAANLVGGLLAGLAMSLLARHPGLAPEWRLFVMTGFLGGLTTFSTFSAESVSLLLKGEWGWAGLHLAAHLLGSLVLTITGFALGRAIGN